MKLAEQELEKVNNHHSDPLEALKIANLLWPLLLTRSVVMFLTQSAVFLNDLVSFFAAEARTGAGGERVADESSKRRHQHERTSTLVTTDVRAGESPP